MVKRFGKKKKKKKEFKWKVVRAGEITVAQGYECPDCGVLHRVPFCVICENKKESSNEE